ncbi:flagellar export chaperone FliS [Paenibacillus sp. GCM10023250]|uniref:flagellar export chaperone FliS n=1 Tax=Paenibacillus sp. GCM10023250 TaxID=3252648 RepID=UPI003612DA77
MLQAQNHYLTTQVQTSSPGELTLMLYNGCIRFIKQAVVCMERQDIHAKHANFMRAQDIIEELQSTLKMEYEISSNLFDLYAFIRNRLQEANVKLNRQAAEDCIRLVTELRDTWAEALKSLKQSDRMLTL